MAPTASSIAMAAGTASCSQPRLSARGRVLLWLEKAVASGEIPRGGEIPSERALARSLGVAQNTAAAAIGEAEARGLVVRRAPGARKRFVADLAANGGLASSTIYVMGGLGVSPDGSPAPRWSDRYLSLETFSRLSATGRHVMLLNSDALTAQAVEDLFRAPPSAMFILSTVDGNASAMLSLERCRAAGVPVAVHGNAPALRPFDRLYTDHRATGRDLVRWLAARGCRRIVPFFPYIPDAFWARERLDGYAEAIREAGLKPLDVAVFGANLPPEMPGPERFRVRKALAIEKLLGLGCRKGGIDALFCLSDNWARVAIAALRDLGIAPHGDILVTGHDNISPGAEFGEFESDAPDATIDKHNETKADAMAALLVSRMSGELPSGPQARIHPHELIERKKQ